MSTRLLSQIKRFNQIAATYEGKAILAQKVAESLLARLDYIKLKPTCILDLGAATGYGSRLLQKRYPKARIFSLDQSMAMLKQASSKAKWFSKQRLICADAQELPFTSSSMDLIFANLVLHGCENINATLSEWLRVLKPDGLFIFSVYGEQTLEELRATFAEIDTYTHVNISFDIQEFGSNLMRIGFIEPILDQEHFTLLYPDMLSLLNDLRAWGSMNMSERPPKGLSTQRKQKKLAQLYLEKYQTPEAYLPATFQVIGGLAWRGAKMGKSTREVSVPVGRIKVMS